MKKFIKKISLFFLAPFIIFGILTEVLLRNIPNDYNYKKGYLDENSNKIENLFLGSSHAYYGVNPLFIKGNSFNASHISQSINYDYEILNKYKANWRSLKYIIMPIDYFTFLGRVETGTEAWRVKNYNIYYNLVTSLNVLDYSELFSFDLDTNFNRIISYYNDNKSSITCSKLGYGNREMLAGDLIVTGRTAAERHTKKDFSYYDKNLDILKSIVEFSEKHDVKVIFYTTPAYSSYVENLDDKQLNLTINTITNLANKHNNCSYLNLLEDTSFKPEDFRDADHLGKSGAEKLSLILNELIED